MDRYIYPAVFEKGEINGYTVSFPDLPGCITEGDNVSEANHMAREALELYIYDMEEEKELIPVPSEPFDIKLPKNAFVSVIEVWMPVVRDEMRNKAVKKTLTIPKWLNDVANENNVNFSQVLQAALKEYLGIGCRK
ncbi:MAG: type II toxin-antitoxin system HicB family antitoxin [Clostridiales bacterium]|nr:type II toxin-antitoxin system HicB family antitoxin [Clostridiales bacterium]